MQLSRRGFLQSVGMGAALAGAGAYRGSHADLASPDVFIPLASTTLRPQETTCGPFPTNSLFAALEPCCIGEPLAEGEMRITFLGTSCTPMPAQVGVSVYVEVGPTHEVAGRLPAPLDYAMFDCGMGILGNAVAAGIPYSRMDKIFIAHLHADHMSELSSIYCFGESADRKSPLYVWGPSRSNVPDPVTGQIYDDGTRAILTHFREVWRWHTESFSFGANGYTAYDPDVKDKWGLPVDPVPVGPAYVVDENGAFVGTDYADPPNDAYALVPIELDWTKYGEVEDDNIAYWNQETGLKITHFPAIHCRKGSISYKLEWTPPGQSDTTLSMIYSGDTRPNFTMVDQAAGIDVLVHEMVMPPDRWTMKFAHTDDPSGLDPAALAYFANVQNSSHTTQGAFGYLLSQIDPLPRLTVATHFQATDDTIELARESIDGHGVSRDAYTFALDFTVLNVTADSITQRRLDVARHAFPWGGEPTPTPLTVPKYHKETVNAEGETVLVGDPEAQLLLEDAILPGADTYRADGY